MKTDDESPAAAAVQAAPRDIQRHPGPDYEAIHAAVRETARGRWFLDEFARRNRTADTGMVIAAIMRLEQTIALGTRTGVAPARADIAELEDILSRTRREIATIADPDDRAGRAPDWRRTVALRTIEAMGDGLRQIEMRLDHVAADRESGVAPAGPSADAMPDALPGDRAAVGRFLKDIAALYADDVRWAGERPETSAMSASDRDPARDDLPSSYGKIVRLR